MRIAYIHQYFNTPAMPGGTRSYEMARKLAERGHEVHMITADRDPAAAGSGWRESAEAGIRVHWVGIPYDNRMSYPARIRAFAAFALSAGRRAARTRPDVVFGTSTPLTVAIPAARAARACKVPMVLEVRDLWPEVPIAVGALRNPLARSLARALERYAYARASRVVALSPPMADGVAAAGFRRDLISVIPNVCDLGTFGGCQAEGDALRASLGWLGDRPLVVYVGTLGLVNDVGWLVDVAAATVALDPEVRFAVIGDGREREALIRRAEAAGVLGRTLFMLGPAAKTEVAAWFAAASASTSLLLDVDALRGHSSNKVFDALAAGRPVLANHRGWLSDLVEEAGAGATLSRDPGAAARELVARVRDVAWIASAGAAARRLAEERFDRDRLVLELERVLTDAVQEARR